MGRHRIGAREMMVSFGRNIRATEQDDGTWVIDLRYPGEDWKPSICADTFYGEHGARVYAQIMQRLKHDDYRKRPRTVSGEDQRDPAEQ